MGKKRVKAWKDIDEVVKASTVPKNKKKWYELMTEVPKGNEKASS
ncbi:MAG: hypothetical protein ACRDB0_04875 [Paraclostridium sp.]